MKKTLLVLGLAVTVLSACGHKKTEEKTNQNKQPLDSTLPVIANAEKNQVISRTLSFPKTAEGVQQTQVVTYKNEEWLTWSFEQISPMGEDLKNAVTQVGVEEAQNLLHKFMEEDPNYLQVKDLPGFSTSIEIINDQEIKRVNKFDFQSLDVEKADSTEYLKDLKLKELLALKPDKYIENQLLNGASEVK